MSIERSLVIELTALDGLIGLLRTHGYTVVGPTLRDGVVVLDEVESLDQKLIGLVSVTAPGSYHMEPEPGAVFGGPAGPESAKRWQNPARRVIWTARTVEGSIDLTQPDPPAPRAYLGIRPCDVAAKMMLGKVWQSHPDDLLIVAECTTAGSTCFCASMGTGPAVGAGADIALGEIGDGRLLATSRSDRGAVLLAKVDGRSATADEISTVRNRVIAAAESMERVIDPQAVRVALAAMPHSAVWDNVAQRCMACSNCTMVCPTCFCTSISDTSDLTGEVARVARWDSCFTPGFSEVHGGAHRDSVAARYRHWITHKLSTWWDQFGAAGCVGCGRCITWCPVGIDITAEAGLILKEVAHA